MPLGGAIDPEAVCRLFGPKSVVAQMQVGPFGLESSLDRRELVVAQMQVGLFISCLFESCLFEIGGCSNAGWSVCKLLV